MPGEPNKPTEDNAVDQSEKLSPIKQEDKSDPCTDIAVTEDTTQKKDRPSSMEEDVPHDPAPEAMVSSSEMDSHFVNTDDLDDLSHNTNKGLRANVLKFN